MPISRWGILYAAGAIALWAGTCGAEESAPAVENQWLKVTADAAKSSFSIAAKPSGKLFVPAGRLNGKSGTVRRVQASDLTFGKGAGLVVSYGDGNSDELDVFPDVPFVLIHSILHNGTAQDLRISSIQPYAAAIDLGVAPADLETLSTAGLKKAEKQLGGYEWLAIADPKTRHGVVAGWLTDDRASGVMLCKIDDGRVWAQSQLDYGRLRIAPGKDARTETLAIGYFDDARIGLETWASEIARVYHVKLPPQPVGYCTWYSDQHGRSSSEKALAELTTKAADELRPFGFSVIQIDDGWQSGAKGNGPRKDFSAFDPKGPYPSGMKATADNITAHGLTPGLWFMAFAGTWNDPFFADHQDWFVKRDDGKPYDTRWGGTSLDMTNAGARAYLSQEVHRISHDWGFRYFKMDGMYTGTAVKQTYVNSSYKPDGFGDAVLSNPDKTNIEAYRDGLKVVRQSAGDGVFLLGCCAPQNMRSYGGAFGLIDAMRVGPDNGPGWKSLLHGPVFASRSYFLNGRVWYNDPDPVYVRASVPLDHARLICSWVTISGDLNLDSDWIPGLPPDRLDLLKRTMPSHGLPARPVDLFENEPPRIWLLSDDRHEPRRDVIALYNWTSEPLNIDYPLDRIGLPGKGPFVAFDYWADAFVPAFSGNLKRELAKESCQILAVRPAMDRPQLISTSRHITQGIVNVIEEKWDGAAKVLSGKSRVVGGDPYELRVAIPTAGQSWNVAKVEVSSDDQAAGVKIQNVPSSGGVRVRIDAPSSREVAWSIGFGK